MSKIKFAIDVREFNRKERDAIIDYLFNFHEAGIRSRSRDAFYSVDAEIYVIDLFDMQLRWCSEKYRSEQGYPLRKIKVETICRVTELYPEKTITVDGYTYVLKED